MTSDPARARDIRDSYDRVAGAYAGELWGELAGKPLDRHLLDRFAEEVGGRGPVLEVGCGPGQVARYLADRGVHVAGVDLSTGMVETAARLSPDVPFRVGDMCALAEPDGVLAGVVAFYAIVHLADGELAPAFREWRRALAPGGLVLVAFHVGEEAVHRDELFGEPVSLDFRFFPVETVTAALVVAGLDVLEVSVREPYRDVEHPSRRAYLLARRRS